MVEAVPLSLSTTALLGLTMGFTACSAVCLPYFGAWILGQTPARPWQPAGLFLLGRVMAYALLGGVAAALGHLLLAHTTALYGRLILAGISMLAGLSLLLVGRRGGVATSHRGCPGNRAAHWPPLLLGMAISLVPCPTLVGVLTACSLTGSTVMGLLHGALFGTTTALAPVLLASALLGRTGEALQSLLPAFSPYLRRGAGLALIALAVHPFV
ncbi:MAG: sulfite exporter TauE/SafE family protein [Magnetococcales bacterium]|nr:sulfite exporter TauE/SafE family protein [Magnetococcales bacterium]